MSADLAENRLTDPHAQLRMLYAVLLRDQNRFDEFKQMLALYPVTAGSDAETEEARAVRAKLNACINEWVGGAFDGLNATQMILWRSIVVEERINVAISPWRESNGY